MSAAVANLIESEREAIRRTLHFPEPEDIFRDPPTGDPEKGIALLTSWLEEDDSEEPQADTFACLKRILFFCGLMIFFSTGFSNAYAQTSSSPAFKIEDLFFLTGKWKADIDGGTGEEHWSAADGKNVMGMYRLVSEGKPVVFTFMVIQQKGMTIRMKADISFPESEAMNRTHRETLVLLERDKAVFEYENKQGRTTYQRTSATTLSVFNTKIVDGKEQTREFKFTWMK